MSPSHRDQRRTQYPAVPPVAGAEQVHDHRWAVTRLVADGLVHGGVEGLFVAVQPFQAVAAQYLVQLPVQLIGSGDLVPGGSVHRVEHREQVDHQLRHLVLVLQELAALMLSTVLEHLEAEELAVLAVFGGATVTGRPTGGGGIWMS